MAPRDKLEKCCVDFMIMASGVLGGQGRKATVSVESTVIQL